MGLAIQLDLVLDAVQKYLAAMSLTLSFCFELQKRANPSTILPPLHDVEEGIQQPVPNLTDSADMPFAPVEQAECTQVSNTWTLQTVFGTDKKTDKKKDPNPTYTYMKVHTAFDIDHPNLAKIEVVAIHKEFPVPNTKTCFALAGRNDFCHATLAEKLVPELGSHERHMMANKNMHKK